ncbi:hypothetical protein EJ07DRAFT_150506 [Lizonia empirigonia]|nr:hypothetical protein EJ07DRAFT_150506 [Lizonia empirigonia]
MPYVRAPVKVTELSWDGFPEPTPEAESWQPNPDSVPMTGGLPDPRFNRNPLTERQRMGLKRERLLGTSSDGLTPSTGTSPFVPSTKSANTSANTGSWPMPAPRAIRYSRASAPVANEAQVSIFARTSTKKPVEALPTTLEMAPKSSSTATIASKSTDSAKGTMETLSVQPLICRPHTPAPIVSSQIFESPPKTHTPVWARPLAHLLDESSSTLDPQSRTLLPQDRSATLPSTSVPPHLRKKGLSLCPATVHIGVPAVRPDPTKAAGVAKPAGATGQKQMAPQHDLATQHLAKVNVGPTNTVDEIKMQKTLLESFIPKKLASSAQEHRRYLNAKLISLMEDEMDMQRRTTRRELHNMSDKAFDSHLARTMESHRHLWEAEQNNSKHGETDPETASADLQQ